jgi:hypothetical protein
MTSVVVEERAGCCCDDWKPGSAAHGVTRPRAAGCERVVLAVQMQGLEVETVASVRRDQWSVEVELSHCVAG